MPYRAPDADGNEILAWGRRGQQAFGLPGACAGVAAGVVVVLVKWVLRLVRGGR
jgi:hypothetical protein